MQAAACGQSSALVSSNCESGFASRPRWIARFADHDTPALRSRLWRVGGHLFDDWFHLLKNALRLQPLEAPLFLAGQSLEKIQRSAQQADSEGVFAAA